MAMGNPAPGARTFEAPAADLEIQVELVDDALRYTLHSASGIADYTFEKIEGEAIVGSPKDFHDSMMQRIENLHHGFGADGELLRLKDIPDELARLGHWLYEKLFPEKMRLAYNRFRTQVTTLQITSDEPWIPWELIKPFDTSESPAFEPDDFLCMQFQLTRWLAGKTSPAAAIRVERLAVFEAGAEGSGVALPHAKRERDRVARLAADRSEVRDLSPVTSGFDQLTSLLEMGHLGLLHFVGHGEFATGQPDESRIDLADRPFRPQHLADPNIRRSLRRSRPLIFLNACRSAQQGWSLSGLGGWANAWVRKCGSGAFIAPKWLVSDKYAANFADEIYTALEKGRTLGEAVRAARTKLRNDAPGRLAWLGYSIYGHPNGRLALGSEDPTELPYARRAIAAPPEIRRHVIDAGNLIEEKTRGFIGRRWVFDLIDRFIEKESRGYFLLVGDPGIGKTALMAELVKRKGYIHHFNIRSEGLNRPENFLKNICAQLISKYNLEHTFLPPEATQDAGFFKALLKRVSAKVRSENDKAVLLVDALDEVDAAHQRTAASPLFLPSSLPKGIYIVMTSRRGVANIKSDRAPRRFDLDQKDGENLADIKEYIESKTEQPGIGRYLRNQSLDEKLFVAEMVVKSQGNFMYLHHVIPAIAQGAYRDRDFSTLPKGLENYYQDHWQLIRFQNEEAWFDYKLPVLVALTLAREPVSIELIQDFSQVARQSHVISVLEEWIQFLYKSQGKNDEGVLQDLYRIYHASFEEFVAAKKEVAGERVDLKAAHGMIADSLWGELYPED